MLQRGDKILRAQEIRKQRGTTSEVLAERTVNLYMDATVTAVQPEQLIYKVDDQEHGLNISTIVWTTDPTVNPLISRLSVAKENRDLRDLGATQRPAYSPSIDVVGVQSNCFI